MRDLSVLIPARREEFLKNTVEDVLKNARANTEVIVVLDGEWPDPGLEQHPNLQVVYEPTSIGQRAATNLAARVSDARYVMKLDAHCAVAEGFDVELIKAAGELGRDVTQIARMYNLHVFNWKCQGCGSQSYQDALPSGCPTCNKKGTTGGPFEKVIVWQPRYNRCSDFMRFDHELHFQYWGDMKRRVNGDEPIVDLMSSVGAMFFIARDRFFEIGGLDEAHGSWGQFGTEIACKSWLSGGRHVVNRRTWFAHLFRTHGGFSFPYGMPAGAQEYAQQYSRNLWWGNNWPGQTRPLSWLVEKFAPVPGWHEPEGKNDRPDERAARLESVQKAGAVFQPSQVALYSPERERFVPVSLSEPMRPKTDQSTTKGLVYYTDNLVPTWIGDVVREQLAKTGLPIVAVQINAAPDHFLNADAASGIPIPFGRDGQLITLALERGYLTMFKQILAGLEALDTDTAFLVEHDVLYHPSHFDFTPARRDTYYYNQHVWKVSAEDGRALHYLCNQTSGLCADRQLLVEHYRKRVAHVEQHGFGRSIGFEPGTRKIRHGGIDDVRYESWMSPAPNIDVRHGKNLTATRWRREEFRNQKYTAGWTEADSVPGWGVTRGRFAEFLQDLRR